MDSGLASASLRRPGMTPLTQAIDSVAGYRSRESSDKIAASARARGQSDQLFPTHGLVGCLDAGGDTILAAPARILGHLHCLPDVVERLAPLHHRPDRIEQQRIVHF